MFDTHSDLLFMNQLWRLYLIPNGIFHCVGQHFPNVFRDAKLVATHVNGHQFCEPHYGYEISQIISNHIISNHIVSIISNHSINIILNHIIQIVSYHSLIHSYRILSY